MKKIILFLGIFFCISTFVSITDVDAQRRPELSGRDGQYNVDRTPYSGGGSSGAGGGTSGGGGGFWEGLFGGGGSGGGYGSSSAGAIYGGNGMYGDSGIMEVNCDDIRAVEVGRPRVLNTLFGGESKEEFLATAECRSVTAYHYLRRISYIYFGFGVIALTFLAYFGQFTYKRFFMFCAGLFILAAGQSMVELLN